MSNWQKFARESGGISLVLLVSLALRLPALQKNAFDYDEGHWLMFATLVNNGYPPYTETFVGIPPLALWLIQLGQTLFGSSLTVRLPMMMISLVGVAVIYKLARRQARFSPLLAGLLAAILLSFQREYFFQSVTIMAEVPAVAMALLSVALAETYRTKKSLFWAALSGAAFAASLLLKLFVVFLPLIIALQLLASATDNTFSLRAIRWNTLLKSGGAWLAGLVLPILALSLIYNPAEMFQQVVAFRFALRDVRAPQVSRLQNLTFLINNIGRNYLPLLAGAALGLFLAGRRDFRRIWLWPAWLVATFALLLMHVPLRERYTVMLLPPLAALSGIGVAYGYELLGRRSAKGYRFLLAAILAVAALLTLQPLLLSLVQPPKTHSFDKRYPARLSAAGFAQRITPPDTCIITDDQRFAFIANRLVPPFLSETSTARLDAGRLTADQIIQQAQAGNCVSLVYISDRFDEFLPDLQRKAEDFYSLRLVFAESAGTRKTLVFAVPANTNRRPQIPLNLQLVDKITLAGADVSPGPWQVGQPVIISTYWQTQQPLNTDYKIFMQLLDEEGRMVTNFDHYPFETTSGDLLLSINVSSRYRAGHAIEEFPNYPAHGLLPTRLWLPGNTLKETFTTTLPADVPPGNYRLSVGLYNESSGEALPVVSDQPPAIPIKVFE